MDLICIQWISSTKNTSVSGLLSSTVFLTKDQKKKQNGKLTFPKNRTKQNLKPIGGVDLVGGVDSQGGYVSKILHVEMKESGPLGGGRAPGTPPCRSANADFCIARISRIKTNCCVNNTFGKCWNFF